MQLIERVDHVELEAPRLLTDTVSIVGTSGQRVLPIGRRPQVVPSRLRVLQGRGCAAVRDAELKARIPAAGLSVTALLDTRIEPQALE